MRRKHDADRDQLEGVAKRLRAERPEASPLELDRIKTTAMSRAKSARTRGRVGTRRLAMAGLTAGLLLATTGGVLATTVGGNSPGNAAVAQYGNNCIAGNGNSGDGGAGNGNGSGNGAGNGNGNGGSFNGNGSGDFNCNENSFNTEITNITTTNNYAGDVTNTYTTVSATPSSGVDAAKTTKPGISLRDIKIHIHLSRKSHLSKVTLKLNGKTFKVLKGKAARANINLTNLPCSNGATTITIVAVTSSGKTVTESHTYHLCQA